MPCSASCDRLPCDERCPEILPCGHQCPSLCGESCPVNYCQVCSDLQDQRVDMLELKTYGEIDVDDIPIIVLTCGHFFTAETLDGHVGMSEVYVDNDYGEFIRLREPLGVGNQSVPRCPDCQCPILQYATQRYNRVINRAVIDETSKKFIISGQVKLQDLGKKIDVFENELEKLGASTQELDVSRFVRLEDLMNGKFCEIEKNALKFINTVDDKNQPVRKLHDAIIKAIRAKRPLEQRMQQLSTELVEEIPCCDRRVIVGGQMIRLRAQQIYLQTVFRLYQKLDSRSKQDPRLQIIKDRGDALKRATMFFEKCERVIQTCAAEQFPKHGVEARLYYGRVAMLFQSNKFTSDLLRKSEIDYIARAKEYLQEAEKMCSIPFDSADSLRTAAQETLEILSREKYEAISPKELASIKAAMVSGSEGIATHAGHWYNCENGHPVSELSLTTSPSPFAFFTDMSSN